MPTTITVGESFAVKSKPPSNIKAKYSDHTKSVYINNYLKNKNVQWVWM